MGIKTCKVCEDAQSKYKCPTCLIPYCSLACFKKHKENPCAKPDSFPQEDVSTEPLVPPVYLHKAYYVDEPSELLQQSQLESIASSSEIREVLKDEKLQKLIHDVVSSAEPDKELGKAMEVDAFCILSEKILSTLGSQV